MVGDIAMTIGQLRYYPMPLNVAQIHEVHTHGALLDSVASPAPPTEAAPNEAESITSSMQEMQRASEARMEASDSGQELNSVAQVAELLTFTPDGEQVVPNARRVPRPVPTYVLWRYLSGIGRHIQDVVTALESVSSRFLQPRRLVVRPNGRSARSFSRSFCSFFCTARCVSPLP